jgi:CNT family concentrative nucleoside transporter
VVINEFVAYLQLGNIVNGSVEGVTLTEQGRLIATYALCGFANFSSIAIQIGGIGGWFGYPELSFQQIVGYAFAPIMWLLGAGNWAEALHAGSLFGTKLVLNEFVAFIDLGKDTVLSPHMVAVVTFALCGFANFSSIAIQMAVTGGLAPNQRPTIARLGLKALVAGSLSNLMSAALAGLFLSL